jgi:hypothetical protein
MCQAEDDLEDVERENDKLRDRIVELMGNQKENQEALIAVEELYKLNHSQDCFNKYAGCVCIKRFADYVETPNSKYDDTIYMKKDK